MHVQNATVASGPAYAGAGYSSTRTTSNAASMVMRISSALSVVQPSWSRA